MVSGGSAFGQISPILKDIAQGKEAFKQLIQFFNRRKTLVEHNFRKKKSRKSTEEQNRTPECLLQVSKGGIGHSAEAREDIKV